MPISRVGPTPAFGDYLTRYALIPKGTTLQANSPLFVVHHLQWIEVPSYQRGVSWSREHVEDFLDSNSILLGNVIFGSFNININAAHQQCFPVGNVPTNYLTLVDGLQRFSVGTAILTLLHPLVLDQNPSKPLLQPHFQSICTQLVPFAAVYMHNDDLLRNFPRAAVKAGYERIRREIKQYIDEELQRDPAGFGAKCTDLFLDRQVAIDEYHNFSGTMDLVNTFLGINTVRMDLSPVDLLRAHVVDRAERAGWNPVDIETTENDFVEVFMVKGGEKARTELLPFVGILLEQIDSNNGLVVFPSWGATGGLTTSDVDSFLTFVSEVLDVVDGYVDEIRNCGAIPFACLLGYYYEIYIRTNNKPSFITGGNNEWAELHNFLRGAYRAIVAGRIGKTKEVATNCLLGNFATMSVAGDQISNDQTNYALNQRISLDWLKASLELADKNRSKRIFNAMLLGLAPHSNGTVGSNFAPITFGRKAIDYHVDHLLPAAMKTPNSPGAREVESIRNFAPLPMNQNKAAKATSCSTKLQANGIYDVYIQGPNPHPYCSWLIVSQAAHAANLDDQTKLEPNAIPPVGDERLSQIASWLRDRL